MASCCVARRLPLLPRLALGLSPGGILCQTHRTQPNIPVFCSLTKSLGLQDATPRAEGCPSLLPPSGKFLSPPCSSGKSPSARRNHCSVWGTNRGRSPPNPITQREENQPRRPGKQ